jgi:hypothetical protein
MKKFYVTIQIMENGKYYAYYTTVSAANNLLSMLKVKGVIAANIFETKKRAGEVVKAWNNGFVENGTYLFDSPSF